MEKKEQKEMINFEKILDQIIASTFTRHSKLSYEEFMKELGVENPKADEKQQVRELKFALICACAKEMIRYQDKQQLLYETLKLIFNVNEEDLKEKGE